MTPYYDKDGVTLYYGSALDLLDLIDGNCVVITGPPWRENLPVSQAVVSAMRPAQAFVQWNETEIPPCALHLVAVHTWLHDTGRCQKFYEFDRTGIDRNGRIFRHAIIDPSAKEYVGHPHQFPLSIADGLIAMSGSRLTVVDPFAGSGTTLLAAKRAGRKAIGIELREDFCALAAERLRAG